MIRSHQGPLVGVLPSTSHPGLLSLRGEVALVTGSTRGIGVAIAEGLARAGARVLINGRSADAVGEVVEKMARMGLSADAAPFDVTDQEAVDAAIEQAQDRSGALSILVNNAGITRRGSFVDQSTEDWQAVLSTNVEGVRVPSVKAARKMIENGRGKIINICSLASEISRAGVTAYATSKGAVRMLTRSMAVELARFNIQVNGIGPGYIRTELNAELTSEIEFDRWVVARTPAGRWGRPEDLVGAAQFLASSASNFVTGQIIYVDGGILAAL